MLYSKPMIGVGLFAILLVLSGCGGGGSTPGEVKGQLTESDGRCRYWDPTRPADLWMCTARQSGTGTVVMRSESLDSEMYGGTVDIGGTLSTSQWSDDRGTGGDEECEFQIDKDQVYFVIATTPDNGPETGAYTLTFSREFGNVRAVSLSPGQVIPLKPAAKLIPRLPKAGTGTGIR